MAHDTTRQSLNIRLKAPDMGASPSLVTFHFFHVDTSVLAPIVALLSGIESSPFHHVSLRNFITVYSYVQHLRQHLNSFGLLSFIIRPLGRPPGTLHVLQNFRVTS